MPGRNATRSGYISLTEDQWNVVTVQKMVEAFWFTDPKGWWQGPDGYSTHPVLNTTVPYLHYPGIRDAMVAAGVAPEYLPQDDWILGEFVHKNQMPRCVPTAINGFIELFFGSNYTLFGHQLGMYYTPQRYNVIVGGRGSSKTFPIAMVMLIWTALHPGEPWLHVGYSLDQAKRAYQVALDIAGRRHYRQDGSLTPQTFSEVFIYDRREFPQPNIYFRPWDEHDGGDIAGKTISGNIIMYRPLGDEDLERLRSLEAGCASGDEILREVEEEKTIKHVRGCLRGQNPWLMAHLSSNERAKVAELQQLLGLANVQGDKDGIDRYNAELQTFKVQRSKRFFGIGNAGHPEWVWEVMDQAVEDPNYAWFLQVNLYDNIRLTPSDREALEEAWGSDPDTRDVELLGMRPLGLGTEVDPELLFAMVDKNLGGQILKHHPAYGIVKYMKPPKPGHFHIISGDPGKDRLPRRNSWCVMVLDITADPAEIVYFDMGNLKVRSKTYAPYLDSYKFATQTYPVLSPEDVIFDNGGQQSGMHELLGIILNDEELSPDTPTYGSPYNFDNTKKYTAANWLIDLASKNAIVMPDLRILIRQVSNWRLPDKKIAQDAAITLFMLVYRAYYIISDRSLGYGQPFGESKDIEETHGFVEWVPPGEVDWEYVTEQPARD